MTSINGEQGSSRRAVVVGSNGQDGRHLVELLRSRGYQIACVTRDGPDITDKMAVREIVNSFRPHEIYLLAAYHQSAESPLRSDELLFEKSLEIHVNSTAYFLEAIARNAKEARIFFASSSHIFSDAGLSPLNEESTPRPGSIYAITKYGGMLACKYYRDTRGVFASTGILFNHESSFRPAQFLSRKIAIAVARIKCQQQASLELGDLEAVVDWGYAADYVDAMHRILQVSRPADYVVATGMSHSVREFVDVAFRSVGLDYRNYVSIRAGLLTKHSETRVGDAAKLTRDTGWKPTVTFEQLVQLLVRTELASADLTTAQAGQSV